MSAELLVLPCRRESPNVVRPLRIDDRLNDRDRLRLTFLITLLLPLIRQE